MSYQNFIMDNKVVPLTCGTSIKRSEECDDIKGPIGIQSMTYMSPIITSSTSAPFQWINMLLVEGIIIF